jgi:hypothetical protein
MLGAAENLETSKISAEETAIAREEAAASRRSRRIATTYRDLVELFFRGVPLSASNF